MNNRQILQGISLQLQQDQIFLRTVLSTAITDSVRELLNENLREYMHMESEAANIAACRCWTIADLRADARLCTRAVTRFYLAKAHSGPEIASLVILRSTKNMIRALTERHNGAAADSRVNALVQRYVDCQAATVRLLKLFYQPRTKE